MTVQKGGHTSDEVFRNCSVLFLWDPFRKLRGLSLLPFGQKTGSSPTISRRQETHMKVPTMTLKASIGVLAVGRA